jgi:3'-phosphoadenosine 5'-phosphosulfate sulfotransferase (PAPS reductase)/FAD synthetase
MDLYTAARRKPQGGVSVRQVVSYGGGTNSAAMLVGLHEHGERPDAILFADTGAEKPHTYQHLHEVMSPWCARVGFPEITVVKGSQPQQIKDGGATSEICPDHA